MEQRSMFELLEIRRFQQFHFQDEIFVELVRRQIIHQEELVDHIHARRVPHLRKICLSYVIQRKEFHFLSKRSASKTGIVHAINPYRILMKILLRHHNRIISVFIPFIVKGPSLTTLNVRKESIFTPIRLFTNTPSTKAPIVLLLKSSVDNSFKNPF